jgi:hypothetical protein
MTAAVRKMLNDVKSGIVNLQQAIDTIQIILRNLRADVDSLIAHTRMKPNPKGPRKKPPQKG